MPWINTVHGSNTALDHYDTSCLNTIFTYNYLDTVFTNMVKKFRHSGGHYWGTVAQPVYNAGQQTFHTWINYIRTVVEDNFNQLLTLNMRLQNKKDISLNTGYILRLFITGVLLELPCNVLCNIQVIYDFFT